MEMRECDVELFEDNPEEFIRRDLEGSDVDTRRRAASTWGLGRVVGVGSEEARWARPGR